MFSKVIVLALALSPLVAAHGKIAVMTGDAGGNTTGLGIQGGIVPGAGKNKVTEVDTTVFKSKAAATDGLGKTTNGQNSLAGISDVVAQSGSTFPQVSASGGSLSGTLHVVTTDGAGPYTAIIDPTGTGAFSTGTEATVTTQVPGTKGNIAAPQQRSFIPRMLVAAGIMKRAANVNEDFPIAVAIPAGMTCTGTVGGQSNVCLVKLANPSGAGPFGGVIAMQIASGSSAAAGNSTAAAAAPASSVAASASAATSAAAASDDTAAAAADTKGSKKADKAAAKAAKKANSAKFRF